MTSYRSSLAPPGGGPFPNLLHFDDLRGAEALRVRAEAANAQTVKMLAVAALGVAIGGVVTGAVFARSGR